MAPRRFGTYQDIQKRFGDVLSKIDKNSASKAMDLFSKIGRKIAGMSQKSFSPGQVMASDSDKLYNRITEAQIGKMVMFFYNPKLKDDPKQLPYYDRVPLIIPIGLTDDGFIGINFHYLPPMARAMLLDIILKDSRYAWFNDPKALRYNAFARRRINMTYSALQSIAANGIFKPCVKRYLYSSDKGKHVMSRFYVVDPNDWTKFIYLPVEDFVRRNKMSVWQDSMNKVFK